MVNKIYFLFCISSNLEMNKFLIARDDLKLKIGNFELIFLGTNGWYDTDTGNTISTLIKNKDFNIIIDAGFGIYKLEKYADFAKPSYLFISHFHLDHICGLHLLCKFKFKKGLNIFIKKGMKKILNNIVSKYYTVPFSKLKYKVKIFELGNDKINLPFKLVFADLLHSVKTLGFRFEINGKVISVISDTGYCENAVKLSSNSDLLITECSYLPNETNKLWPHLNPQTALKLKKESNSKKLVLTHFAADKYLSIKKRFEIK